MHYLHMSTQSIQRTNELLKKELRRQKISQESLALKMRASQSQVSRILSGKTSSSSKLARDIDNYVFMQSNLSMRARLASNEDLMSALEVAWDGTPAHARALAAVIRSLTLLAPSDPPTENIKA